MNIEYKQEKALPSDQLYRLFRAEKWADGSETSDMVRQFNAPFLNSTLVVSAWDKDRLVGAVRVLSDRIIRSVIYDLLVDPEYRCRGIGRRLVAACRDQFPGTEWLVQTTEPVAAYYEKLGFRRLCETFLHIPSAYQK